MNKDVICGYIILALENLKYSKDDINKIVEELYIQFNTITENEAEQYYLSGDWKK